MYSSGNSRNVIDLDTELRRALTNAGYTVKAIRRTETPLAELRERLKQGKP
jgi:hypothetical protein